FALVPPPVGSGLGRLGRLPTTINLKNSQKTKKKTKQQLFHLLSGLYSSFLPVFRFFIIHFFLVAV
ncbi:hypothetical protein, partial [Mycobacterium tuberculosis]|uniref:hypothetical protein n=1 Tax=Mycobacterium tuberculosis TaxID=1773 RepID=UPI001AE301E4